MKIFVDENIPYLADILAQSNYVMKFSGRNISNKDLIENECDALFVRSTTRVDEILLNDTKVLFVGTSTSGIDHIDADYLKSKGIQFVASSGSNANSVAELVVFSILKWSFEKNVSLKNKIIGVIGYGNIGKIVACYSHQLGLKVLVNDPPLKDENYIFPEFTEYCDRDIILSSSDIITNHVPLVTDGKYPTVKLIDSNSMNKIRNHSLFIHTSRGGIIDENELTSRLMNSDISAVIDVWENEPLINIELAKRAFIAMPHVAGYSRDGKLKGALMMIKAFEEYTKTTYNKIQLENELYSTNKKDYFLNESNKNEMLKILHESRNFEYDHAEIMGMLNKSISERAKEFDRMRKQYPQRRETLNLK